MDAVHKPDAPLSVGVDGCRAGWIAVADLGDGLTYRLHASFAELLASWSTAQRILVDIPIGLPWRDCPSRPCDRQARAFTEGDEKVHITGTLTLEVAGMKLPGELDLTIESKSKTKPAAP